MAYHQPLGCISSRAAKPRLYLITPLGVYQKFFRNDDIQSVALMICNSLGTDDIHDFVVICFAYIYIVLIILYFCAILIPF